MEERRKGRKAELTAVVIPSFAGVEEFVAGLQERGWEVVESADMAVAEGPDPRLLFLNIRALGRPEERMDRTARHIGDRFLSPLASVPLTLVFPPLTEEGCFFGWSAGYEGVLTWPYGEEFPDELLARLQEWRPEYAEKDDGLQLKDEG